MKITVIEMSLEEAMVMFPTMDRNEEPEITEIHEDFAPGQEPQPKPAKKPKAKKGKVGRTRKTAKTEPEPAVEEADELPR